MTIVPRRWVYIVGVLSAVKALGLVLLAESIARGVAAIAAGDSNWRYALLLGFAAGLLRAGAAWATSVASARAASGVKESLRARLAERVLGGPSRVGSTTSLATRGLDELDEYFTSVLPAMTSVAVIPLLIGARILAADWVSAVILVLTVPLIPVFMVLVGQHTQAKTDAAASALDRLSDHVVELARGLPVLVGLGRSQEQAAALERISDDYRKTTMLTLRTAFLSSFVLELIATISVAVVAVFIGIRILGGGLTLEVGLVVLVLAPECYAPFRDLGTAFHASRAGKTAFARVNDLLEAAPAPHLPRTAGAPAVHGLTVTHEGRETVVADLSFTLPALGITALTGASGSGKSTVLRALADRLDPGAVATGWIQGVDVVGWAPQHPRTVGATVRDELALYGDTVDRYLDALGLRALEAADPARLSPGELRRLAVARALLRLDAGATVILLDEPTAHLDDAAAAAVLELIADAGLRASVVVASHDAAVLALADHTVQLGAPGALRARGTGDLVDAPFVETSVQAQRPVAPLRALAAFVTPALGRYLAAGALGTLAAAFAVALTAVSAWLIVRASEQPGMMYLLVAIVGVRFFGLGRAALRYSERLVTHDAVFVSATALRLKFWNALAARGAGSRALQRGATALDYLVGATDDVRDLAPRVVVPALVGVAMGGAAVVTTALLLPAAVPALLLMLLVTLVVAPAVALIADRAADRARLAMRSGVLRQFAAALEAADDLRGNGVDATVRARLAEADVRIGRAALRSSSARGLGAAIVILAVCVGAMAMLLVTADAAAAGLVTAPVAAVLVLLPIALVDSQLGLLAAVQHWPALAAALGRTTELDGDVAPAGHARLDGPVESLRLTHVAAAWPGAEHDAFTAVTAHAVPGEWIVVQGPSGAGKSTLLSVLTGGIRPTSGWVELNGADITTLEPAELHRHIASCPQDAHLFDSTVRANLLLGRARDDAPSEAELEGAMRTAGLGRLLDALPDALDTRIGSEGSHLSGGERQRLAVARTLLSRAAVVLLDEPTAHLDEDLAGLLMADLRDALHDRIVVLVTHHADELHPGDEHVELGRTLARIE